MPRPDTFQDTIELFSNYKERLDSFFVANDIATDVKRTATLLSSIGPKTYITLRSLTAPDLPSTKTYEQLCALLISHFCCPAPLEIVERFKFHKRNQETNESLADYIAAIKNLSQHCNFGDNLQMALRDRFLCGINDEAIQKRLLQEQNLTLERATTIAMAMETASKDAAEIHGASSSAVHKLTANKFSHQQYSRKHVSTPTSTTAFPPCQSCGKYNHRRSDSYLRNSACRSCSKPGHIEAVCCKSNNLKRQQKVPNQRPNSRYTRKEKVHELDTEYDQEQYTLDIYHLSGRTPKINIDLKINKVTTTMELDTGSAVSVMTQRDFVKIFQMKPSLEQTNVRLKTFTNEIIVPLGKHLVNVELGSQIKMLPLLILEKGNNPIFGRDWLSELKLDWQEIKQVSVTKPHSEQVISEFPELFSAGIGKVKDIKASIKIRKGANTSVFKARSVLYSMTAKIKKELDNLEKDGILTKVTKSEWATPIVPVMKKNGQVRICGDFKVTINPVLEAEQYTLPRIEDMVANLQNGQTFSKIDVRQAYHQLELDHDSKPATTINTHKGLYVYNRLAFGITSAPAIWQRTMDTILQDLSSYFMPMQPR